jgi:glycosyltransferase involved in cell wall biosynthesis
MTPPVVTVVVPVRNGADGIRTCLTALAAQRHAPSFEVIVVDNDSDDDTAAVAREHAIGARVVSEKRRGSYAARNAGIAAAGGAILAFTDADCMPEPGWLAAATAAIDTGADLAAGGIVMPHSPHPSTVERYDSAVYLRQEDLVTNHGWAVTANLVVRRSVIDAVGPFDAALPSGGDREFCRRAVAAGHKLVYVAEATVGHQPRTRLGEIWRVNRRIGSGFHRMMPAARRRPLWQVPELWQPLDWVVRCVAADGPPLRRRRLVGVHAVAMAGRWVGLVTGR